MRVKVCPVCNRINEQGARVCAGCSSDIRTVRPQDENFVNQCRGDEKPETKDALPEPEAAPPAPTPTLTNIDALNEMWMISGDGAWKERIPEGDTILGREGFGAEYFSGRMYVGRKHCKVTKLGEMLLIKDLNSTNGTFVNGKKLGTEGVSLKNGDLVGLGGNDPEKQTNGAYIKIVG